MAKRVIGRKSCVTILLCGGLYSLNVGAAVEGEITPVGGPKMYNIDVANQDITNNSPGATIPYVFSWVDNILGLPAVRFRWKIRLYITRLPHQYCSREVHQGI